MLLEEDVDVGVLLGEEVEAGEEVDAFLRLGPCFLSLLNLDDDGFGVPGGEGGG